MRVRYVVMIGVVGFLVALAATDTVGQAGMAESGIRRFASHKPLPAYPAASVTKGSSGVAVATIVSGPEGTVTSATILEAPDEEIANAVRVALLAWKIPAVTTSGEKRVMGVKGKITFYFTISGGRGRVLHPEDMPGGPKPEPASGPPTASPGARPSASPAAAGSPRPPATAASHAIDPDWEIGEPALAAMAASKPVLLDIRERDDFKRQHRAGAINIPGDELAVRAYIELKSARPVVIDCTFTETNRCHNAANLLRRGPKIATVLVLIP